MQKKIRLITSEAEKSQYVNLFSKEISVEQMDVLTDSQYSRNSLLAMTKDWNLFVEFCQKKSVRPLPAAATAMRLFIEKESASRKYATIKRYAVTIGLIHRILQLVDPSASSSVKLAISKLRLDKAGDAKATDAFEKVHLEQLTNLLSGSVHPRDIRNLAIYHLMFECLLKRGELRDLTGDNLLFSPEGIQVMLGSQTYPLSETAELCLRKWLALRNPNSTVLFNAISKHGNIDDRRLDDSSIYRILRNASDKLGLDLKFSGQSLRVGAAKELAKQGSRVKDIQQQGRWLSAAMPYYYVGNKAQASAERMVFKRFKPWD